MANGLTYIRKITSPDAMRQLGSTLAPYLHPGDCIVLEGDLGAGKTQFVQGVAAGLGVRGQVVSPTFNVVIEHRDGRIPLYHFDLYRLEDSSQLEDVGFYDLIDADGVCFLEWGEKFPRSLPYSYLQVVISIDANDDRNVRIHSVGLDSREILCVWANDSKSRLQRATGWRDE